jgi:hypothetical protein
MSAAILALTLLCAPIDDISGPATLAPPAPALRRIAELDGAVNELIRRESRAQSDAERAVVAFEMTKVYQEIKRDPRLVVSDSLKEMKLRLWNRLTRVKKDVLAKLKREGRPDETLTDSEVLALADHEFVSQSLADHLSLAGTTFGGPTTVFGQATAGPTAFGGAAGPPDYGTALVDLIQQTIVPDFWDVNGGPGTIVYFRPLMCLVVRATSDVHHQLGGTVGALRAVK